MINTLPTSLIAAATSTLNEALAAPAHKQLVSKAANKTRDESGMTAAERITHHVMPIGQDRMVIPLERTFTPDKNVTAHLAQHGYEVHDYEKGLAVKPEAPDRKLRIGGILHKTSAPSHVIKAYEKDPARQGIRSGEQAHVVICRKPSDVGAMSTHQSWESCQTLGGIAKVKGKDGSVEERIQEKGSHSEMVPGIISAGTHVAYLVHHPEDVDKHYAPIARVALNPYVDPVSKHTILHPSKVYGDEWEGFHHTVKKWTEKHTPATASEYLRHKDSYPEGDERVVNYSPEHNEFWKSNMTPSSANEHPNPDVLSHYVKRVTAEGAIRTAKHLLTNPHLPEHMGDSIVDHFTAGKPTQHNLENMASAVTSPKHIQKLMDSIPNDNWGEHVGWGVHVAGALAGNENATHQQLHTLMDKYGASPTDNPGVRETKYGSFSSDLINGVVKNKNSNDSHFHKVFELPSLHQSVKSDENGTYTHFSALTNIAKRYHDESIGRNLIDTLNTQLGKVMPNVVSSIAEKHPHLLSKVSDGNLAAALSEHRLNANLYKANLERNTPTNLKAVAHATNDQDLLHKLSQHPDQGVANAANYRIVW